MCFPGTKHLFPVGGSISIVNGDNRQSRGLGYNVPEVQHLDRLAGSPMTEPGRSLQSIREFPNLWHPL